jgi:hypothetical protein
MIEELPKDQYFLRAYLMGDNNQLGIQPLYE